MAADLVIHSYLSGANYRGVEIKSRSCVHSEW